MLNVTHQLNGTNELKEAKDIVRATCGSLLQILPDETVSVVHHSLTEFLRGSTRALTQGKLAEQDYLLKYGPTHAQLAFACLSYLNSGCLDNYKVDKTKLRQDFWKFRRLEQGLSCDVDGVSPLHVAAYLGLADYIRELLQRPGANANIINENDENPLYWAAYKGHHKAVKLLLQYGADPNRYSGTGLTPLHEAARRNHPEAAQALLTSGADPLIPRTDPQAARYHYAPRRSAGRTPLQYACMNGHDKVVAIFLPFLKEIRTVYRALHWGAESGQAKVVACILTHSGVDVNSLELHNTALFYACTVVSPQTIEVLLGDGANPNVMTQTFYHRHIEMDGIKVLEQYQPDSKREPTALHILCDSVAKTNRPNLDDARQCFELVRKAGVDLEQRDSDGKTALHRLLLGYSPRASETVCVMLRLLLDAGADANAESDDGSTPLHGNPTSREAIRLLIEEGGADINKRRSSDGKTPILCLLSSQSPETSLEFLRFRPDCNAVDNDGNSALHVALSWRMTNRDLIVALRVLGADINKKNHKGQTPLHIAGEQEGLFRMLVEYGADLEAQDNKGYTALFQIISTDIIHRERSRDPNAVLKAAVELGAKTDCRDYKGRTLLHEAVHCDFNDRLRYFLDLGLSPYVQDGAGNSLWHEAIFAQSYSNKQHTTNQQHDNNLKIPDIYNTLTDAGVDSDQPTYQGRTPLHVACSIAVDSFLNPNEKLPLDYLLSVSKNMSPADCDGVTPLHIAATISEYYVAALLRARAHAAAVTLEGLTPLHLAARACQSNIVNLLLKEYERDVYSDTSTYSTLVNYLDNSGRTALHYACRSGRPEVVASLLASGANVNIRAKDGVTPLQECTKFESEQEVWRGCNSVTDGYHRLHAAGLKLNDESRPYLYWTDTMPQDTEKLPAEHISSRIEEILEMIVTHSLDFNATDAFGRNQLQEAISSIQNPSMNYTIGCFLSLVKRLDPKLYESDIKSLLRLRKQIEDKTITQKPDSICTLHLHCRESEFEKSLALRDYTRIEDLHQRGEDFTQPSRTNGSQWHSLVCGPYGRLFEKLCTNEIVEKSEDEEWCKNWQKAVERGSRFNSRDISPLLIAACNSSIPNMDVVKVLVEVFNASINAQICMASWDQRNGQITKGESALHILARGRHWWQVHQALPYLISHGANIELKDDNGRTPLHISLEMEIGNTRRISCFQEEAARILVSAGANIHAINNLGRSCQTIAVTSNSIKMIEILLPPESTLNISALFIAIEECNDQLKFNKNVWNSKPPLTSGAYINQSGGGGMPSPHDAHYENSTIIHDLLESSKFIQDMTDWESLNLEHRDGKGRTLLLAACRNRLVADNTAAFRLIEQGADLSARDTEGKNVLHHIFESHVPSEIYRRTELIKLLLSKRPELVYEEDMNGNAPINCVQPGFCYSPVGFFQPELCSDIVDILLDTGSDPLHPGADGNFPMHLLGNRPKHALFQRFLNMGVPINIRNTKNGNTSLYNWFLSEPSNLDRNGFSLQSSNSGIHHTIFSAALSQKPLEGTKLEDFENEQLEFYENAGGDFLVRNNAGETLLHALASASFQSSHSGRTKDDILISRFEFLVAKGLDPLAEDGRQRTALDIAVACGNNSLLDNFRS
ncbi:ankyrin repeat [Trichoderma arundinaceum]|uniref:Ankyrin repeat n=1 Tax=Trichoderma arundinaceum TaxID=490622 RepID=A0A395NGJ7_TRIAR|nr:ankyrin repeat [Trichoderma arundinaceum]